MTDAGCAGAGASNERTAPNSEALLRAVEEAAAREHGAGYGSRRKGRRCNLGRVHGCIFCRTLAGMENK